MSHARDPTFENHAQTPEAVFLSPHEQRAPAPPARRDARVGAVWGVPRRPWGVEPALEGCSRSPQQQHAALPWLARGQACRFGSRTKHFGGVHIARGLPVAAQGQSGQSAPSWRAARSHGPPQARHARMCRPCGGPRRLGAGTRRALPPLLWTRRGLQCLTPCPPLARAQTAEESLAQHILLAASKMAPAEGAHEGRYERSERADKRGAGSRKGHEESSPPPSPERESWGRKKALPRVTKTRTRAHMRRPRRRVAAAALRSLFLPETPAVTALGEAPRRHASTMQGRTSRGQGHHANPKMRHFGAG